MSIGGVRLLIDPWLVGPEVDYFRWFNTQWLRAQPVALQDIPPYDVVLITQKYPDHLHPQTLRALQPAEVWAPSYCTARVSRILPQARVRSISQDSPVLRHQGLALTMLPSGRRFDPIYEAWVLDDGTHSLVFAPHGLTPDKAHTQALAEASPCLAVLASLRAYHLPWWLGGAVSEGAVGLQTLVQCASPRWVIATHDEDKRGWGLVPTLARIQPLESSPAARMPWLCSRLRSIETYEAVDLGASRTPSSV